MVKPPPGVAKWAFDAAGQSSFIEGFSDYKNGVAWKEGGVAMGEAITYEYGRYVAAEYPHADPRINRAEAALCLERAVEDMMKGIMMGKYQA